MTEKCKRCHRELHGKEAINRGYGDTCWGKLQREGGASDSSIDDVKLAMRTLKEFRRRVLQAAEIRRDQGLPFGRCALCNASFDGMEMLTKDNRNGFPLKGYSKPQRTWFQCKCGHATNAWNILNGSGSDIRVDDIFT